MGEDDPQRRTAKGPVQADGAGSGGEIVQFFPVRSLVPEGKILLKDPSEGGAQYPDLTKEACPPDSDGDLAGTHEFLIDGGRCCFG